jgi:hypothetical protein
MMILDDGIITLTQRGKLSQLRNDAKLRIIIKKYSELMRSKRWKQLIESIEHAKRNVYSSDRSELLLHKERMTNLLKTATSIKIQCMVFDSIIKMNYTLSSDDMMFALDFTSTMFSEKEPTSVALEITPMEFINAFSDIMEKSVLSGCSHASHSECGDAVALNIPYDQFIDVEYNVSSKIEPMFALFDMLKYVPSGKCLYIFSIASDGRGLASQLLQYTIDEAKAHGFTSILADCTNIKSQNLFAKFGFVVRSEITYGGFEHKSVYSFKNVSNTKSIQKMELVL